MASPTLPTELLINIFSTVSSPSDLYRLLQASKRFASIARTFLYHHIIIETKGQREKLENVREEDKKLVKKLTIKGDGPIEISKMKEHFENGCKLGGGCLADLYEGKLLDISTIKVLHVINVHEDLRLAHNLREVQDGFTVSKSRSRLLKTASSLFELQIVCHQGGGNHWTHLPRAIHPVCARLAYRNISKYDSVGTDSDVPRVVEYNVSIDPIEQLGIEVSVRNSLYNGAAHLKCISEGDLMDWLYGEIFGTAGHSRSYIWLDLDASELNRTLSALSSLPLNRYFFQDAAFKPRFLLLPAGTCDVFPRFDVDCSNLEIHYYAPEERNSFLLIPPQFIDYVARMKALENGQKGGGGGEEERSEREEQRM